MGRDLIDRKQAIDAIEKVPDGNWRSIRYSEEIKTLPSAEPLTEEDYAELKDRFGGYVEFIVRDMIDGKGERWK